MLIIKNNFLYAREDFFIIILRMAINRAESKYQVIY